MDFVIGIESTAHTFGVGVVSDDGSIIVDFSDTYRPKSGGIHPREAAEHHAAVARDILKKALSFIKSREGKIVAVGFSRGPGLGPCLRIGATFARTIALYFDAPLYGIHHAIAHIEIAKKLTGLFDPLVVLVSGGHTVITSKEANRYVIWGETLDISLGNLIDMFMRAAGYSSPAGHICEKFAEESDEVYDIPYVVKGTDLSFSGILSALRRALNEGVNIKTLCRSLQEVAFAMLCEVTERALVHSKKREILLCGGVANNKRLQEMMNSVAEEHSVKFAVPDKWNGDNGAMIAWTTLLMLKNGGSPISPEDSYVLPLWRLDKVIVPF
ncbi:MAG: KEOPS complex N(6)-L-threonylcarbamoyladenine synthase Kae1 [Candidatus Njordarchaeota archaeon]